MAWQCSASSHRGLIDNLVQVGLLRTPKAIAAMAHTDRGNYCPIYPYIDAPQPIGYGQTISAPHIHAGALEQASPHLHDGSRVLDVGCGSGYLSACFARLVAPSGRVLGIDNVPELVNLALVNTRHGDKDLLDKGILSFRQGDGWRGAPNEGPYDWIYVGAAASQVPPALLAQLADKGSLLIPVGQQGDAQSLLQITRDGPTFHKEYLAAVQFLQALVASMFELPASTSPTTPWHLEYIDMDGDVVRVANDAELQEALAHLPDQASELVVKLTLSLRQRASMTWQAFVPALQQALKQAEEAALAFLDQDGMDSTRLLVPRHRQAMLFLRPENSDTESESDDDDT
ncbi:hypothetical protein DYB25_000271 [Aphanomyces astaci]|uniref:protein-L-isoaspartate(D-aspartate) O-methyltransferase n=1 Tax=Aphanomyces astaci TaxID=112090 RepID=A0A397BB51_APHAT|nr:hypothetical protein DYB25_000271 [Aphanomyces astaci]RHY17729.1 hypothetical protein DYB36_005595 [Aphanomyces astaci]RHY60832.1 hypothetical protein DYB34_004445 [Aphanomyces astaci]